MITLSNKGNTEAPNRWENRFVLKGMGPEMLARLSEEARRMGMGLNRYILTILEKELIRLDSISKKKTDQVRDTKDELWISERTETFLRTSEDFCTIDDSLWE